MLTLVRTKDWRSLKCEMLRLHQTMEVLMAKFDDLIAEVAQVRTTEQSAVVAIQGLIDRLAAIQPNPTSDQIQAVINDLTNATGPLAAAIASVPPSAGSPGVPGA